MLEGTGRVGRLGVVVVVCAGLGVACTGSAADPVSTTSAAPTPVGPVAAVDEQPYIVDGSGRVLVLHGTNVDRWTSLDPIAFGAPSDDELDLMVERFGFDHVRLLLNWSAIEPTRGDYDEAYFEALGRELDRYRSHHLRVLLDVHQGCPPSRAFTDDPRETEYSGAPRWAVERAGVDLDAYTSSGHGLTDCTSPAVQQYLRAFFLPEAGHPDLAESYQAMVTEVVGRFASHPAVIGFDLMNEPTLDTATLAALVPRDDDTGRLRVNEPLTDFLQRTVDAARTVDADTYLFVEPSAVALSLGYGSDLGPLTDPREGTPRLVFAPHLYEAQESDDLATYAEFLDRWFDQRRLDAEAFGGPVYLGEFGNWRADHVNALLERADDAGMSWANWSWSGHWALVDDEGDITQVDDRTGAPTGLPDALTRPHPTAIAGVPISWSYAPDTRVFHLRTGPKPDAEGPTEVFVPSRVHYRDGWALVVDGTPTPTAGRWQPGRQQLHLDLDPSRTHQICIAPTAAACT